jgi:hypothetical protein
MVTLLGGAASGAVTLLAVATVMNAGKPGTLGGRASLAVWAVGTVAAMLFIGRAAMIRRAVSRTCLALGVQGVVLPLATLVSFAVAGARLAGSAGTGGESRGEPAGPAAGRAPARGVGGPRGLLRGPGPRDRGATAAGVECCVAGARAAASARRARA